MLTVDDHPLLELRAFQSELPAALGTLASSSGLLKLLAADSPAPLASDDDVRRAIRDLLRQGGFKPTGRNKPASEYLLKAAGDGSLGPINLAVDAANVASLHSGLPISVVDLARTRGELAVRIAAAGTSYVFNRSGQSIDVGGLLCLCDQEGPCANGVKDAQRTKTDEQTLQTLTLVWGTRSLPGRAAETEAWLIRLLENEGVTVRACEFETRTEGG